MSQTLAGQPVLPSVGESSHSSKGILDGTNKLNDHNIPEEEVQLFRGFQQLSNLFRPRARDFKSSCIRDFEFPPPHTACGCRSFPSAYSINALQNPINIGCGRNGRLVNSGWACVPTKYGCISCGNFQNLHDRLRRDACR